MAAAPTWEQVKEAMARAGGAARRGWEARPRGAVPALRRAMLAQPPEQQQLSARARSSRRPGAAAAGSSQRRRAAAGGDEKVASALLEKICFWVRDPILCAT